MSLNSKKAAEAEVTRTEAEFLITAEDWKRGLATRHEMMYRARQWSKAVDALNVLKNKAS